MYARVPIFYQLSHTSGKVEYFQTVKVVIQRFRRFQISEFTALTFHYGRLCHIETIPLQINGLMKQLSHFSTFPDKHEKIYDLDVEMLSGVIERH